MNARMAAQIVRSRRGWLAEVGRCRRNPHFCRDGLRRHLSHPRRASGHTVTNALKHGAVL